MKLTKEMKPWQQKAPGRPFALVVWFFCVFLALLFSSVCGGFFGFGVGFLFVWLVLLAVELSMYNS